MTEEENILICIDCVKDVRYKKLISGINTKDICTCCQKKNYVIDTDSNEFIQMTKALIRYHYNEWDYNHHFGGVDFINLFEKDDNIFLNKLNFNDIEVYEELLERINNIEVYEEFDEGVSLFAGYYDGEQNPLLESIRSIQDNSIINIKNKLITENYFKYEDELTKILHRYSTDCKITIEKAKEYYRARIGFAKKKRDFSSFDFETEMVYEPYSNSEIGAPPPHLAGDGRINRIGVSYLYCATDQYTAIAEIRPHPGDIISIGKFIVNEDLSVFDLTASQFVNYYKSDKDLADYKQLNTFTELLQKVITPSERKSYNITQLLADCIRKLNFDAILFPSSVSNGENLVVFNPEKMQYTYNDAQVVQVNKVGYDYIKRMSIKDINEIDSI